MCTEPWPARGYCARSPICSPGRNVMVMGGGKDGSGAEMLVVRCLCERVGRACACGIGLVSTLLCQSLCPHAHYLVTIIHANNMCSCLIYKSISLVPVPASSDHLKCGARTAESRSESREANCRSSERARSKSTGLCGSSTPPPTMASKRAPQCSDCDDRSRRSLTISFVSFVRGRGRACD